MKKSLIIIIAVVLLCFCVAGTTFAWLMSKSQTITNTFVIGNVTIRLSESTPRNNKLLPGDLLVEDPKVTVKADSEDCWLFIKVDKSDNFDYFMDYKIQTGWTALDGYEGVYYREVALSDEDQVFGILLNDKIYSKDTPTKEDYEALNASTRPTIAFTAYGVQKLGYDTPLSAWNEVKDIDYIT